MSFDLSCFTPFPLMHNQTFDEPGDDFPQPPISTLPGSEVIPPPAQPNRPRFPEIVSV